MGYRNFEIVTDEIYLSEDKLIEALNKKDNEGNQHLIHYAYILHNKDIKKDGSPRAAHWHILIKMDNAYTFDYISKRFGVEKNFINKIRTKFSNALNYLTHNTSEAKKEHKHVYEDDEVKSNYAWKTERQKAIDNDNKKNRKMEIVKLIENGTIRKFNYYDYITVDEYIKYKKDIDNAFNYRIDKIKGVNREMEVIFINGSSGSGKTTYAKEYAKKLGYSIYVSSGSNDVLDDYAGQDCIILDDLRPSCMGLSDLLKMLDNHSASTVKSRYKNKVLECKLIIITSILDIDTFFKNVFSEENEPIKQLKRRCQTKIKMDDKNIYVQLYDEKKEAYGKEIRYDNTIKSLFPTKTYETSEEYENATKVFAI